VHFPVVISLFWRRNRTLSLTVWNKVISKWRSIENSTHQLTCLWRCHWMGFLWSNISISRNWKSKLGRFSLFDSNVSHSDTLFLIFLYIYIVFISNLLTSSRFILIINFLYDTSASIEVIITAGITLHLRLIFSCMQSFENAQRTCICSFWGFLLIYILIRLQIL